MVLGFRKFSKMISMSKNFLKVKRQILLLVGIYATIRFNRGELRQAAQEVRTSLCKEQTFSWFQSVGWGCERGTVVIFQEQHPLGQDHHGRPHHAVFFNQVVGGVLAPSGSTSSSSPKST